MFSDVDNKEDSEEEKEVDSDQGDDEVLTNNVDTATLANPKKAKRNHEYSEQFKNENEFIAKRLQALREVQAKKFNRFPVSSGLSGHVFQSGKVYIGNDAEKETNFVDEIDNQTKQRSVKNFMIGPVFGKDKSRPIGIIQFINKQTPGPIGPPDKARFLDMADLIGLSIENTMSITQTIGVTLKINEHMENIHRIMQNQTQHSAIPAAQILEELTERFKDIKVTTDKLIQDR